MPVGFAATSRARRAAVVALVSVISWLVLPVAAGRTRSVSTFAHAENIGTEGYVYGIPLMEFLNSAREQASVTVPNSFGDAPVNQLGNDRYLVSPGDPFVIQPNNDTLYSPAHLDLSQGPLVLHVPAMAHHRYYSFQFIDPYTNVFAYVGTRATGDGAGNFLIAGPDYQGPVPQGMREIRSAYDLVWLLGRTLVYGPSDLPKVRRIQDAYRLLPLPEYETHGLGWRPPTPSRVLTVPTPSAVPRGLAFFDALGTALTENPPPARDAAILATLRSVGIGPGLQPSQERMGTRVKLGLAAAAYGGAAAVAKLKAQIVQKSVHATHGWFVPPPATGAFGTDYDLRAVIALNGIAANRPAEAVYSIGLTDSALTNLDGAHDYVIHFPAKNLPPARYFWSLTMYDHSFELVENPIDRYEIGNRTAGLHRSRNGSLDLYLSHTPPPGHQSNWLPAPAGGFEVTLRMYGPLRSVLAGRYRYPRIVETS
jgi:hypothetical protein